MFQLKPVVWLGSSLKAVQEFPSVSKRQIGLQLALVQSGEMPSDWKPLRGIGSGVYEIRVHGSGEFRVVYVAKFAQAIFVLHAFGKKSRKAATVDVRTVQLRYSQLLASLGIKEH